MASLGGAALRARAIALYRQALRAARRCPDASRRLEVALYSRFVALGSVAGVAAFLPYSRSLSLSRMPDTHVLFGCTSPHLNLMPGTCLKITDLLLAMALCSELCKWRRVAVAAQCWRDDSVLCVCNTALIHGFVV